MRTVVVYGGKEYEISKGLTELSNDIKLVEDAEPLPTAEVSYISTKPVRGLNKLFQRWKLHDRKRAIAFMITFYGYPARRTFDLAYKHKRIRTQKKNLTRIEKKMGKIYG